VLTAYADGNAATAMLSRIELPERRSPGYGTKLG
jgi:hypothetical protein